MYKDKTSKDAIESFDIQMNMIQQLHLIKIKSDLLNRKYLRDSLKFMDKFEDKMQIWNMKEGVGEKDRRLIYPNLYSNTNISQPMLRISSRGNMKNRIRPVTSFRNSVGVEKRKMNTQLESRKLTTALESLQKEVSNISSQSSKEVGFHMIEIMSTPPDLLSGEDAPLSPVETNHDLLIVNDPKKAYQPKFVPLQRKLKRSRIKKKEIPLLDILKEKDKTQNIFEKLFSMELDPNANTVVDKMIGN